MAGEAVSMKEGKSRQQHQKSGDAVPAVDATTTTTTTRDGAARRGGGGGGGEEKATRS